MNIIQLKSEDSFDLDVSNVSPFDTNAIKSFRFWTQYIDLEKLTFHDAEVYINNKQSIIYKLVDAPKEIDPECVADKKALLLRIPTEREGKLRDAGILLKPQYRNGKFELLRYPCRLTTGDDFWDSTKDEFICMFSLTLHATKIIRKIELVTKSRIQVIEKERPTPQQVEEANKTGNKYISRPITIKNITIRYVYEPHPTRKINYTCEAWNVRGHYRHYKTGKIIYVKPYIKGSGKVKNTTYII